MRRLCCECRRFHHRGVEGSRCILHRRHGLVHRPSHPPHAPLPRPGALQAFSPPHSLSLPLSLPHICAHALSYTHTLTTPHTLHATHFHTLSYIHTAYTLTHTLTHTHCYILTHTLVHTRCTHPHTLSHNTISQLLITHNTHRSFETT